MPKTVLVTGAAQGIGKAIALQLAKDGYQVAIMDLPRQQSQAQEVVELIKRIGPNAIFVPGDVSERTQVFEAVETTYNKLGGFDTIVNNAGIAVLGPVLGITPEMWERSSKVNIASTIWGIQAAAEKFIELGKPGKIINAGSVTSHEGSVHFGAYAATKHAIKGLTQTAAKELASNRITVNAYCPGMIRTEMWDAINEVTGDPTGEAKKVVLQKISQKIAFKEFGVPQDVADLVSFLASEKSNYVTGQSYIVDGGFVFN